MPTVIGVALLSALPLLPPLNCAPIDGSIALPPEADWPVAVEFDACTPQPVSRSVRAAAAPSVGRTVDRFMVTSGHVGVGHGGEQGARLRRRTSRVRQPGRASRGTWRRRSASTVCVSNAVVA